MQRMVLGMLSDCLSNLSESRKRVFLFPGIGTSHQTGLRTKIWGGNLSLPPISGIFALNDDCGDLARGPNSPSLRQREEKRRDGSAFR